MEMLKRGHYSDVRKTLFQMEITKKKGILKKVGELTSLSKKTRTLFQHSGVCVEQLVH